RVRIRSSFNATFMPLANIGSGSITAASDWCNPSGTTLTGRKDANPSPHYDVHSHVPACRCGATAERHRARTSDHAGANPAAGSLFSHFSRSFAALSLHSLHSFARALYHDRRPTFFGYAVAGVLINCLSFVPPVPARNQQVITDDGIRRRPRGG